MNSQVLSKFPWPEMPTLALFIFLGIFMVMLFRLFFATSPETLNHLEQLPLQEDDL